MSPAGRPKNAGKTFSFLGQIVYVHCQYVRHQLLYKVLHGRNDSISLQYEENKAGNQKNEVTT